MVILDTCCIIELCKKKPELTVETLKRIESGAEVLSVSFAEIACKIKLGKLILDVTVEEIYENYREISLIKIIDIGVREWLDSILLNWKVKDPADRLIVSRAKKTGCHIVTSDKKIKKHYKKVCW